jgi:hypothetical protein
MDRAEAFVETIAADTVSMLTNVEWNALGLVGAAAIARTPGLLNRYALPSGVVVDAFTMPGEVVFGVGLPQAERSSRADELIAASKRTLVCDAAEVLVEGITRMDRWCVAGVDIHAAGRSRHPEDVQCKRVADGNRSPRELGLVDHAEQAFLRDLVFPLRHAIRHNNGRVHHATKSINYAGTVYGQSFDVHIAVAGDLSVNIQLDIGTAFAMLHVMKAIANKLNSRGRTALAMRGKASRSLRSRPRR